MAALRAAHGKRSVKDYRITQCKICPSGVFEDQQWEWWSGTVTKEGVTFSATGIVHSACVKGLAPEAPAPFVPEAKYHF